MFRSFIDRLMSRIIDSDGFKSVLRVLVARLVQDELLKKPRIWGERSRFKIGKDVQLNDVCVNTVGDDIKIDEGAFLGHGVSLLTGHHDYRKKE